MTEQLYDIDEAEIGEYLPEDADAMLDALVEADGEFAERRRSRPRGRAPARKAGGTEVQRNAQGIKAINDRITALDLASSFDGNSLDVFQVVKGSFKSGFLGEPKGALGNPAVIGAIGLLLKNPGILGSVLGPKP